MRNKVFSVNGYALSQAAASTNNIGTEEQEEQVSSIFADI
jgi:hypothetical protein